MNHEFYMQRCFQLAKAGKGTVSPNPLVGSVIVHNNKIIGEGYHHHQGGPHAEVMAIGSVKDKSLLSKSQIYVSLEPCSHYGSTPPCASLIIEHHIPKVIISCKDPHEKVAGKGIQLLEENGVEVIVNILVKEGEWLNRRFFTFHRKKRPYIILKWAQSQDGFIDILRDNNEKGINWITQPHTKIKTHRWRTFEDAILIGKNTALIDDPSLTARNFHGKSPTRIVIDKNLELPLELKLLDKKHPTIVFNNLTNKIEENLLFIKVKEKEDYINTILKELFNKNIQSLIVEGGAQTINSFLKLDLWDEARVLTGIKNINHGLLAPSLTTSKIHSYSYGKDNISLFVNTFDKN